ncbi:11693_t:CDS:2 [Funneliformis geosporum]|uniref:12026_t:CDS:1 n=1 Tax=Funneliformis geosporum TaxID=1117311 RepID=A0A9W4SFL3_9GLOM|nr:12026_t:CDS:2 [Funneliformis geosporum]CAI2167515.1 11693_t:CDS:2 [Funneliformis geosporum]
MVDLLCFFCRKVSSPNENAINKAAIEISEKPSKNVNIVNSAGSVKTIPTRTQLPVPPKVLQLVFSYLNKEESKGLFSCLFVNKNWHANALKILWNRPFTSNLLTPVNSVKLIETFILCLDSITQKSLKKSLKRQKIKFIISNKPPLCNYATLLGELSYGDLEKSIHHYLCHLHMNSKIRTSIMRKSSKGPPSLQSIYPQIELISKNLFLLFIQKSTVLESLSIDKYCDYSDLPAPDEIFQRPLQQNYLSQITKLQLNYYETSNIFDFLKELPETCKDLLEFDVRICEFENEALVNKSIANVITSQRALRKFSMEGAKNCGGTILTSLGDTQSDTLTSVRFKLMNFKSSDMKSLAKCGRLKELSLENCQGLTKDIIKILLNAKLQNLRKLVIWNSRKDPHVTSLMIKSAVAAKKLSKVITENDDELRELALDTVVPETVDTILNCCSNLTTLKILDYQPKCKQNMYRLLKGLPSLENLTINRETKIELGVINFSGRYIPDNVKYLRLECGITPDQLNDLLNELGDKSKLRTLILDYFKLEVAHLKAIIEWNKRRRTLKTLGIGGKSEFSERESKELSILQDQYNILELLKNKDLNTKEATSKSLINHRQEIFDDLGNYGHRYADEEPSEKPRLREFSMEFSSTTELSSLPTKCLEQIFKNVEDDDGSLGLFSCLLVCRAWCRDVVPLLWSRPFSKLPKDSRYKLIRTYITCLSREEKSYLNSQLLNNKIRIPDSSRSLINYSIYLKELSYIDLYHSVDSGIKYYRKSFIGRNTFRQTSLISRSICKMFLTKNITDPSFHLQSFRIDKHFVQMDIFPEIDLFSKVYPGLSQITKLTLNYDPNSENLYKFLQSFPSICRGLNYLNITLPYFETNPKLIDLLISIIKAQRSIHSFHLSGARIGANLILPVLLSEHSNYLISMKFQNVNFNNVNLHAITSCLRLEELTISHCTGLDRSSLPLASRLGSSSFFDNNGLILKSLSIGCSPIYSQISTIILNSPIGTTCRELCLDLITPKIIKTIKRYCQNVTTLKLRDYFINNNDFGGSSAESSTAPPFSSGAMMLRELFNGIYLERLIISISPKNSDYEELNIHGRDLPASCWYLKLQCGFSVERLDDLLLSDECMAPISVLILDYSKLHLEHFKAIRELVKKKRTLTYFGICGRKGFDDDELKVIKDLQHEYNVVVNLNESDKL